VDVGAPLATNGNRQAVASLDAMGVYFTVDQWNWYREQGGASPIAPADMDVLVMPGENRAQQLLVSQYLARLERLAAVDAVAQWA
jgi:hypothetical protein